MRWAFFLAWIGWSTVLAQPVIVSQPRHSTNLVGTTATFHVEATGTPPLEYQWRLAKSAGSFGPLQGETNSVLTLTNVALPGVQCDVIVSNSSGAVTSRIARLFVRLPLSFVTHPVSLSVTQGAQVLLSSLAQPGPLTYQWHCNGRALPGETTNVLRLSTTMAQDAGDYFCVAFDGTARATSQVARLEVAKLHGVTPSFVNFETPVVHPMALSPNGTMLAVCNLPDNRLELFDVRSGDPVRLRSVPVGLDPVSVRFRTDGEAWVVNHISDSISVVDVNRGNVVATLTTPDTPADVVFAGEPVRAYVSCALPNVIQLFDPLTRQAGPRIAINGDRPKSLAVSLDGRTVYAAIFESGNGSTILGGSIVPNGTPPPPSVVDHANGPYRGQNPLPNSGSGFNPTSTNADTLARAPRVAHIVKKTDAGRWLDDNNGDWTEFVSGTNAALSGRPQGWDLIDHDVAVIDTATLQVSYVRRLMNICMDVVVNPASGQLTVIGIDGLNEIRFEPNLNGIFLRVRLALVDPVTGQAEVKDLNPHLDYATRTLPEDQRIKSVGDPRAIVWNLAGTRAYVAGMGSDNVVVLDAAGDRVHTLPIHVGEGPAGLALDEGVGRLYVLNRFASTISVIDTETDTVLRTVTLFDPTPQLITAGRKHLYSTHKTSGLGHVACGSCHVDARMDRLAWDLGDPAGAFVPAPAGLPDFHPMKGPMVTTTFQDMIGHEPLHWRGDRTGIEEFNPTFTRLQGATNELSRAEMAEFKSFLASIHFPPNPHRQFDNSLPTSLPLPGHVAVGLLQSPAGAPLPNGNAQRGFTNYSRKAAANVDGAACIGCHRFPAGLSTQFSPPDTNNNHRVSIIPLVRNDQLAFKGSQLRNLAEKVGMDLSTTNSRAGFGFSFNGRVDSLTRFLQQGFPLEITTDEITSDLIAFLFSLSGSDLPLGFFPDSSSSKDVPAAVGRQLTLDQRTRTPLFEGMLALATNRGSRVELVAKGSWRGQPRGWFYDPLAERFQSDRASQVMSADALINIVNTIDPLTFTVVPRGSGRRIGIDRDDDGLFDQDELDTGSDPARADFLPLYIQAGLVNNSGEVVLTWNSVIGHSYRAEFKTDLSSPEWKLLGSERVADNSSLTVIDQVAGPAQRFYRVTMVE